VGVRRWWPRIGWRIAFCGWSGPAGGSCPVEKRELDQRVRLDVADMLDGVSNQSAAALRPVVVV
jgi:hypothetical protein